ncbi:MAG: choice-of-anchor J domain-containing protein [Bacteroidaceae bacterium]|nr:choice-of-anchor J domain-containing protein [Bacteroidaceae bacterium]
MKRKTLLMTLLMLIGFSMANAVEVEVGTMETNKLTNQFPTNPYFAYSLSQQIYTGAELGITSSTITSISFYRDWTSETIDQLRMSGLRLYLKLTTKSQFDSDTDMVPVEESDLYWSGTLSAPAVDYKGWVTINLDKPFPYDGSNLLVCFYDPNPSKAESNTNRFYYVPTSANTALTYFSNDVVPDLTNINEFAGTRLAMSAHNWAKFTFNDYFKFEIKENNTRNVIPVYSFYKYSLSQQIYSKEEVGESRTLNSISFYNIADEKTRTINIYLVQTDKEAFADDDDWISYTNANMVFSGDVTFNSSSWTTIPFDIPFAYSNESNLAVIVADNSNHDEGSGSFIVSNEPEQKTIVTYTDVEPLSLSNYSSYSHYRLNDRNKVRFNEGVTIGDATDKSLPVMSSNMYSVSQQIYNSYEMLGASAISSISFCNAGAEVTRNITVRLQHTDISQFNHSQDWITYSDGDYVFQGDVTFKSGEWTTIRFDKYFDYNGADNLAVIVDDNTGATAEGEPSFVVGAATGSALMICGDDYNYVPGYLSGYTGELKDVRNLVKFNEKGLSFTPTTIDVTDVTWEGATITWDGRGAMWNLRYKRYDADEWTYVYDLTEPTYQLTGLEEDTGYFVEVQGNDGGDLSSWLRGGFNTPEHYPSPVVETVLETAPHSAILKWTDNCDATAWQLLVQDDNGTERIVDAGTTTFVLTGLEKDMYYHVWVRAVIDAENEVYSKWSGDYFFFKTTKYNYDPTFAAITPTPGGVNVAWEGQSNSYTVRYRKPTPPPVPFWTEDFESLTTSGELPAGWTTIDADGDGFNWSSYVGVSGIKYHSGQACLYSESYDNMTFSPLTPDNWLISPQLELKGIFSAWLVGQDISANMERFAFYVSTTGTDLADFVQVLPVHATTGTYHEYTADLSAYEGQMGYIAIRHYDCTDQYKLNVDDISLSIPFEDEPWQTIETKDLTATIQGLEYDTEYEIEVIGNMKGQPYTTTGVQTFTTLAKNPAPADFAVNPAATTADVSWTGYSEMYEVKYRTRKETVVYSENFDSGDLTSLGWTVYTDAEARPGYDGWYINGSGRAVSYSWTDSPGALNADNWLISPLVDLNGTLRYWEYSSWGDSYEVLVSTTGIAEADFTEVLRPMTEAANADWNIVELDLSAFAGQQGYIAFHHKDYDKTTLCIDKIDIFTTTLGEWVTKYATKSEIALKDLTPNTLYELQVSGQMTGEPDAASDVFTFTTRTADPVDIALDNLGQNGTLGDEVFNNHGNLANVTINNLTLKSGVWQAICLPFDVDVENSPLAGADVRMAESYSELESYLLINCPTPQSTIKFGTPYYIKWNGSTDLVNPVFNKVDVSGYGNTYDLGTSHELYCYKSLYYLFNTDTDYPANYVLSDDGNTFTTLLEGYPLKAFEPYLYFDTSFDPSAYDKILLNAGDNDIITGISSVKGGQDEVIYNVAGQRLNKKQRGINIVNGKKVLVK